MAQPSVDFRTGLGVSYSLIGFEENKSLTDGLLQYSIGAGLDLYKKEGNYVRAELQLARRGYSYKIKNYFDKPKIRARLPIIYLQFNTYFQKKLNLLYKKRKNKKKSVHALFGGFIAGRLKSKWRYSGQTTADNSKINNIDAGLIIGIKYQKRLPRKNIIGMDFRYSHSLTNILDHPFNTGYLRSFEVGLFYKISAKKKKKK